MTISISRFLVFILLFCITFKSFSQAKGQIYSGNKGEINYSIYSNQIDKSIAVLKNYFNVNQIQLTTYTQNNGLYEYKFNVPKNLTPTLDSIVNLLGFRASKTMKSGTKESLSIIEIQTNIDHLKLKKGGYQKLLSTLDTTKGNNYLHYFEKIVSLDDEIFQQNLLLNNAVLAEKVQTVEIYLHDDYATSPYKDVTFVHMPGVEYNMLFVENATPGTSSTLYQGYSLKYLFTRGKSYFSIGALKPATPLAANDSSSIKDIFSLNFGQDFYNRHLGRGKKKFLNLYIGYHIGLASARSHNADKVFAMLAPVTGIELFKNKYFVLDVNGSYYIPLNTYSYTLRGIKLNASLNFSF